ncbi:MAG: DUF402 domain-containing protein [Pseudonocardia sp.]|uniref:DUF402 domain-containing protein n=1 Tax=unclassified Pseudonocardia TaxID=2619320 RepID=UPI00086E3231|nr:MULTISPECIES: DUF402 domain-containing protein [unclassified Pseudonocardia]MBN9111162.1 DUF402 domain-containing protein [Pseudonocardia sp.]ODV04147.1 MAG: DUF402 domain-containing protein [Pseudonocardia sp. SCN 73-27]
MHPPKIQTFDVDAAVNTDNKGFVREVATYRVEPFGLYMSRAIVDRPSATWIRQWLLPDLGIGVAVWEWTPDHVRDQDFYLDIARIEPGTSRWTMTDLYLDVVVRTGRETAVIDVDEFVGAVAAGVLDPALAEYGMQRAYAAVAALAAHGNDLDAWLATEEVTLTWD